MKRKYDCPKVKIGDWVYISDWNHISNLDYDSVCKYKVIAICNEEKIIVEVKDNGEDSSIILGWPTDTKYNIKKEYNLPSGIKAWVVTLWRKAGVVKCLNIE